MEIVYRPLAELHLNPKNPRKVTQDAVAALAESIKANPQFFEARPILLSDRTGKLVIIGGERRSEAARLLEMTEVPTILMSGLTEAQEDEIMVRDNTHAGIWDDGKLAEIAAKWGEAKVHSWTPGVYWINPESKSDSEIDSLFHRAAVKQKEAAITITISAPAEYSEEREEILAALHAALIEFPKCKIV